jgi:hypothetical protein
MMGKERILKRLAVSVLSALVGGFALTGVVSTVAQADLPPTPSLPIDVVFVSANGATAPLTEAQYVDYMTEVATWWTTQARGLLGPIDPASNSSSYGAFSWTPYAQIKYLQGTPCPGSSSAVNTLLAAGNDMWGRGSDAYTSADSANRRLLVVEDGTQCPMGIAGQVKYDAPHSMFGEAGFPGWGSVYSRVNHYDWPSGRVVSIGTLNHEMGHTFGLAHTAGLFTCADGLDGQKYGLANEAVDCLSLDETTSSAYGDGTNIMGKANTWQTTGLNGYQKILLGIIADSGYGLHSIELDGPEYPSSEGLTLPRSDEIWSNVQAVRVVDSVANPKSEYVVDVPGTSDCTVRVLRVAPLADSTINQQSAWYASMTSAVWSLAGSRPDSFKVDNPHTDSTELCLTTGDTYKSWSGNMVLAVDDVWYDDPSDPIAAASITVYQGPTALIGSVTVAGEATVGSTLTASANNLNPSGASLTYQWRRGMSWISGATASTYVVTPADVGNQLSVVVVSEAPGYMAFELHSPPTAVVPPIASVGSVTLSGLAVVGSTLNAVLSDVVPSTADLTYTWSRQCVRFAASSSGLVLGATGSSYEITSADVGCQLWVTVVASADGYGAAAVGSAFTAEVPKQGSIGSVAVAGTATVGSTLSVSVSNVVPTSAGLAYQWYRDSVAISGATSSSYVMTSADSASQVKACVTSTASGYSTATACAAQGSVSIGSVSLQGGNGPYPVVNSLRFFVSNVIPVTSTVTYQWYRGDVAISGASGTVVLNSAGSDNCPTYGCGQYQATADDIGYYLHVVVTASATGYSAITASSPLAKVAGAVSVGSITLSGAVTVGSTMTVSGADVVPSDATLGYYWYRMSGSTQLSIPGATNSLYAVTSADVGYQLMGCIGVRHPDYFSSAWCSTTASVVTEPLSSASIGSVILSSYSSNTHVGNIHSVSVADVTPATATLSYQWYRGPAATVIPGATGPSYTLTDADAGYELFVAVTASAAGYAPVTATSQSTKTVLRVSSADQPILSGSLTVGSTASVIVTNPVPSNVAVRYAWYRVSNSMTWIEDVTGPSYVLTSADIGSRLYVIVYLSAEGYTTAGYYINNNVIIT